MEPRTFNPKYTPMTWALIVVYIAPWLFSMANTLVGHGSDDWKLFWLLSGAVWLIAGLLHLKGALLKRIVFTDKITIEMILSKTTTHNTKYSVRIHGDVAVFKHQAISMQYLANAPELMQLFVEYAGKGDVNMVYAEHEKITAPWTTQKNLICLIVLALLIVAILGLHFRPLHIIGPATDSFLLCWALMLPVLLVLKAVKALRKKPRWGDEPSSQGM